MENVYISFVISLSFNRGFSIVSDIKLLLLTFSKRLDNLLSACVSLDFICSFGFVGLVFIESISTGVLSSPFYLLHFSIFSRIVFFKMLSISFLSVFLSFLLFLFYFCFQIENVVDAP